MGFIIRNDVHRSEVGVANGVASLNGSIQVPDSQISQSSVTQFINDAGSASNDLWSASKIQSAINDAVVGTYVNKGAYNAATNTPDLDVSPSALIRNGWAYRVTVAGTFFTIPVQVGDVLIANQDSPTLESQWTKIEGNITNSDDIVEGSVHYFATATEKALLATMSITNSLWVDPVNGNDSNNGSQFSPKLNLKTAIQLIGANGVIFHKPGTTQMDCTSWGDITVADNIFIYGFAGSYLKGPDRTNVVAGALAFNKKFIFHVNTAKTLNITGFFNIIGDFGPFSTENAGAVINADVNTFKLDAVTGGMNIRPKIGDLNLIVKQSDMIMQDQQGCFVGPGDAAINLNVVNGKIKMHKDSASHASDQTRMFQFRSASTTRPSHIQCNGIESIVDPDHSFTEALDIFYVESPGTDIFVDLRGGVIKDHNTFNDGDYTKKAGQDGCIIMNGGGNLYFNGGIDSYYTQGIQVLTSSTHLLVMNGDVSVAYKQAGDFQGSTANTKIYLKGKMLTGGACPVINHSGSNKVFVQGPVVNTGTDPDAVGILYDGSGLIVGGNAGFNVTTNYPITTGTTGRTFKMYTNPISNKILPASAVGKSRRVTINKVRNSQIYSITINGTAYTFTSSGSATNLNIVTGLVAAIGTPSGIASVTNNGNGTFDILATAGTDLVVSDTTSWTTQYKWEISRSARDDAWRITINGTAFAFTSSDTTYYHETNGGIPDIRDQVKALIQANGTINALVGTYQVDKYGLTLIAASGSVFSTIVGTGNTFGYTPAPHKPMLVTTLDFGMVAGVVNQISGTAIIDDSDAEF